MDIAGNDQINEEVEDAVRSSSGDGGPLGYPSSSQPRSGIDEEIEKNLLIKTMPKRFKVSVPDKQKTKTKAVGAFIMVFGLIVMAAAVYLAYVFLINPNKPEASVDQKKPVAPVVEKQSQTESKSEQEPVKPVATDKNEEPKVIDSPATTTPAMIATTTPAETASTTIATTTPAETASTTTSPVVPIEISTEVIDSDSDGLSDFEESLLGTNKNLADSDGDGFSDRSELDNSYNPAGQGRLEANPNLVLYKDSQRKYSVLRPSAWRTQNVGDSVIFSSPDNSFVQVVYEPNVDKKSVLLWYNEQFSDTQASLSDVVVKNGWEGLYHRDNKIFYLTDSSKTGILTISYVSAEEGDMTYYNIFRSMVSNFSFDSK